MCYGLMPAFSSRFFDHVTTLWLGYVSALRQGVRACMLTCEMFCSVYLDR